MNDLPDGWTVVELGEVALPDAPSEIPANLPTRPYVGLDSVEKETGHLLGLSDPSEFTSSSYAIEPGVVLYSRLRPNLNKVLLPTQSLYVSREFIPLNPCDDLSAAFLAPRLRAQDFVEFAIGLNAGDRPRVKWPQMKRFKLKLPPPEEQDEIVRILDTQLARLDTVLEAVQAVRDRADQLRRSLLHAAFTGQLTQPDPSRGEAVPVDWPVMTLDEINNSDRPICYGILKPGPDIEGGIPYVKVKHIRNRTVAVSDLQRTTPEIEQGFKRSRLEPGDLLITIRGTYGRTAIVPPSLPRGNITQDTARVHAVGADPRYVQNYVESPQGVGFLNSVAKGVAVRGVNIRDLRQMPVPIPPDIEQAEIVRILDAQLTRLYEALAVADRVEAECGRLRRSLLQSAFTGELTRKWREANG